jgi:hypothetical protein
MPAEYEIAAARWPKDTEEARALLTRYGQYLAASPSGSGGVCIAGYEAELRGLPGKYLARRQTCCWRAFKARRPAVSR